MSLQVWLPLNGDLRNQGLSTLSFNNISDTNTTIDNSGKIGKCYSNDSHTAGGLISDGTLELGQQQSMFCWFKFTDLNASASLGGGLVSQHRAGTFTGMGITIRYVSATTGYLSVNTGNGSSRTYNTYYGTTLLQANTWYHGGYTYDGSTIKIYVNGICEKTQAFSGMSVPADYISCFCWNLTGTSGNTIQENYKFQGFLNDVRIYNHCLSESEIKRLAQGLMVHYPLNRNGWGCENMMAYNSECTDSINLTNSNFSLTTEDGIKCAHAAGALQTTARLTSKVGFTPQPNEYVTFSAWIKIKNIVRGSTNPMCEFYFTGQTIDGTWRGANRIESKVDGQIVPTGAGFDTANSFNLNNKGWHYVSTTAQYQNYEFTSTLYPSIYLRDCTGDIYVHHIKFERGQKATPWCPHVDDALATTMGLDSTTEYDISGFGNNGTKIGTFTWTSDTPKYSVSTIYDSCELNMPAIISSTVRTSQLSTTFWVKRTFNHEGDAFICNGIENIYIREVYNENPYMLFISWNHATSDSSSNNTLATGYLTLLNTWTHIVVVFDGGIHKIYINGELYRTNDRTSTGQFIYGYKGTKIGTDFGGNISDFRIYATVLSASDVKSLYQNCATIGPDGTIYGQLRS